MMMMMMRTLRDELCEKKKDPVSPHSRLGPREDGAEDFYSRSSNPVSVLLAKPRHSKSLNSPSRLAAVSARSFRCLLFDPPLCGPRAMAGVVQSKIAKTNTRRIASISHLVVGPQKKKCRCGTVAVGEEE
ncbi:unnamed protein product [Notodromas monacha]|uniref:Uncharacterized protein n=1 Tax=Notodromas monacha TaxID=399045 RepID=A0A7R9GJN0_9CRUS|nr:unnamed protein product [Notodromas monacha]CAG0925154.1 unnamed protein product [Notodromas monacha]